MLELRFTMNFDKSITEVLQYLWNRTVPLGWVQEVVGLVGGGGAKPKETMLPP